MIDSWKFGNTEIECENLWELVINGKKTATSSLKVDDEIPVVGEKSYITNYKGDKKVLIEITNVTVKKFSEVDDAFARKEGEGDLSLDYWRLVHEEFSTTELAKQGKEFHEGILIICEEFKVINEIYLKTPKLEDLAFRKELLSDPDTMEYNAGYDLNFDGYDYDTGCIDFDESKWSDWYKNRVGNKESFYAYIFHNELPVGDVFFSDKGSVSIIMSAKYRNKGYAKEALRLLIDKAFNEYDMMVLSDDIPEDRIGSVKLFEKMGFKAARTYENAKFGKPENVLVMELNKEDLI